MKKVIFSLALFLTCSLLAVAQKGISYQAVILDPNPIEIPGQDITGQPFVNGAVSLKFKIFSSNLVQEFEEVHATQTDAYGMVNVLIGSVSQGAFSSLVWDSKQKSLQVLVSFDQGGTYTKVSEQQLTYNPMALFAETASKLSETLSIAAGGTGATTAAAARTNLGLGNVDNTSDANKPISIATQLALDAKTDALTSYVNNQVAAATIADADATTKGKIQLAGDLAGTAAAPTVPSLALKADAAAVNTALGLKANASDVTASLALKEDASNKVNTPLGSSTTLFPTQNAVKTYVDAQVAGATIADASGSTKGKIQLAGDLGGTAAAPTVPGLTLKLDANQKGVANGVASLNASGIIPSSQIPPVTVSSTTVVGSDAAMTALSNATVGSIAVRTDVNRNYVLRALPASTLGNWIELLTPGAPVQTVNGYIGTVNLTKTDLGLSEVNNTSDLNKPISTATQNALDLKANGATVDAALATKLSTTDATAAFSLKANSADVTTALATKLSTADATAALALKLDANKVAAANGVASLDALGKVPTDQIPAISFSSVKVLASEAEMLGLGTAVVGSVVIRTDVNKNYVLAASNPAVLANWIELLTPAPPVQTVNGYSGNVSITKADLGLGNVQNISDADKVISTRTQTALDTKVDKVTGKSLSTNDYSTAEKTKLAAITGTNTGDQDLSAYVTTAGLNTKVDKETGKGLSTNDYSTAEKTKLAAITGTNTGDQDLSAYATNTNLALKSPLASPSFTGTVAIGTSNPSPSAVLDVTSTSKGLLLPRLTFAQKSAIVSPEPGLIFWCTDCGTSGEMQVYNGTAYVNMIGSPAQLGMPAIGSTTGMSSITSSTASSGGVISSDGGASITARGVVWGTSTNPTIALSTKTTDGTGTGTFTSSLTGLTSGVTYYVRSYATNSVGTKYGSEITFNSLQSAPTLAATTAASSIGATTATSGGTISYNGGATVTVSGLVWSTSTMPTVALSTKTTNGTLTGTYTSAISGLTPGTLYYVRSYATNAVGTSYGAQTSFTTLTTPTLAATTAAISITSTTATSGGNISSDGGSAVSARGIVWGTATNPTTTLTTKTTDGTGTGTYASSLTGLSPATTYYVRSYATNAIGTVYGTEISFTTLVGAASKAMITTQPSGAVNGVALTTQPVIRITDAFGNTVTSSTINVVASIASGTGTLSGTTTVAAVNGVATFTNLVLSGTAGNFTLRFTPTSLTAATSSSFALSVGAATQAAITTEPSGAVNGVALTTQPVIRITDASGNTVTSSTVNVVASIASGTGGTLSGTTTVAAVNGVATFTNLVLSGTAGNFTLRFTPTSLTAATSSSLALSVGAATQAAITTQPSGAVNGVALTTQPVIRITDASGNTVTSSTVNVVASIASGTGGTLSGTTTVAAVNGVATFTNLVLSGTAGNFTLRFTPTSLTAATSSSLALSVGAATQAAITTQPSGAAAGVAFTTQPVIRITDASGNTVTSSTVNVVASIASGTGTLSGTTSVAAVNGVATFTNLVLSGATGNLTLAFTPTSLAAATSNSFALSFGTASKAMITTEPSGAVNGVALTTQPVIRITDASGNTATTSTVSVVASIASGTGGTLSGTTTVAAVNGIATFTNLVLSGTAGNFTLVFTPTSLMAATSSSFALAAGAASKVMITTQPAGAFTGTAFSTQPVVKITDAGGNTITSSTANVVASITSGTGTLSGTTTVAAVAGVATFTNLNITGTGNFTLTFTADGGLTAANSNTVNVAQLGCAQGGNCAIGETGPGGGTVFYYSAAGFNCGTSFTSTGSPTGGKCHYLEFAAAGWDGTALDPYMYWSANMTTSVGATSTEIGSGYKNTELMRVNNGTIFHPDTRPYAGAYIRSKTLGGKSDWYLPSKDELNQLCKWARGLNATTPATDCDGFAGTASNIQQGGGAGNITTGWVADHYWSSSENAADKAYSRDFRGNTVYLGKIWAFIVRPIRSF